MLGPSTHEPTAHHYYGSDVNEVERAPARAPSPRVLLVHRFYAPDVTTYSQMLAMMATQLRLDGHEVSVFTTQPSYNAIYDGPALPKKRTEDGVSVVRIPIPGGGSSAGRLLGGIAFGLRLIVHALVHRRKYDVVMVSTVPPVFMGLAGLLSARIANAKLVYHCMDLYPEISIASGHTSEGLLTRVARFIDTFTITHAARTVVLSKDMKETVARRGAPLDRVVVQNNFTIESSNSIEEVEFPPELKPSNRFRLLFAGNIGRFQGLEALLDAMVSDADPNTEMVFLGAGAAKTSLKRYSAEIGLSDRVSFVDHQPLTVALKAMTESDLAIVSLAPGLIDSAYPSKTVMYLEMGCRVLAIVEPKSELARLVVDNDLGAVATPGEVSDIAAAISAERNRQLKQDDRTRAQQVAEREFSALEVLPRWSSILSDLEEDE